MLHVKHHAHITTYTRITRRDAHHQHTSTTHTSTPSYQRRDRRQVHTPATSTPSYQRRDRRQVHTPATSTPSYQHTSLKPTSINQHTSLKPTSLNQHHQPETYQHQPALPAGRPHITPYPLRFVKIFL